MGKKLGGAKAAADRGPASGRIQAQIEQAVPAGQRDIGTARVGAALGAAGNMQPSFHMRGKAPGEVTGFDRRLRAISCTRTGFCSQQRISSVAEQTLDASSECALEQQHAPGRNPYSPGGQGHHPSQRPGLHPAKRDTVGHTPIMHA